MSKPRRKAPAELPVFEDYTPKSLDKDVAWWIVKHRADHVYIWSDFGWARVAKWQMLYFLEVLSQRNVMVKKTPKFSTYWLSLA